MAISECAVIVKDDPVLWMDNELTKIEKCVEDSVYWRYLTDESTKSKDVFAMMKEVMLEIWSYQKRVDESVFAAVGRLGNSIDEQGLVRSMIAVQVEETGHGTMALGDYIALGGDESYARKRRPSPAAQALICVVRGLGEIEHPLCHLGYMYFFEKFTTVMTLKVEPFLKRAKYPNDRLNFMRLHAEEDIRHADMLANIIRECVNRYEDASEHIIYGFECFREVYPHSVWNSAFNRMMLAKHG